MNLGRPKPRHRHVRTGCLTCKYDIRAIWKLLTHSMGRHRKVKCSEEKPHCARCLKGGFVCKGYATLNTWLFEPRSPHNSAPSSETSTSTEDSACVVPFNPQRPKSGPVALSLATALCHGNSDPFDTFAIPIHPIDNFYIHHYETQIVPQLYTIKHRRWTSALVFDDRSVFLGCMQDAAAAYSFLARLAAIFMFQERGSNAKTLAMMHYYQIKAQAGLRHSLKVIDRDPSPDNTAILTAMWASHNLGYADMITQDPNATFHLRAMSLLYMRGLNQARNSTSQGAKLFPIYLDIQRACVSLSRPLLDAYQCFRHLDCFERKLWTIPVGALNEHVHLDVKDPLIRKMILLKREGQHVHRDLNGSCFAGQDLDAVSFLIHCRNIWFQSQILNRYLDMVEELKSADLATTEGQCVNTRAYVALAALHWGRFASQFPVNGRLLFNDAPAIIPRLRELLQKSVILSQMTGPGFKKTTSECARLWALFVGAQTEQNREDVLGLPKLCGHWFLNELRLQAQHMEIFSWDHAVSVFEQFLYSEKLEPHISNWW